MEEGPSCSSNDRQGEYTRIQDEEDPRVAMFDNPLPCFGCGIGWSSFLLGFPFPFMWYYATILYFLKYYDKDPRERSGLFASTIMAMTFTLAALIALVIVLVHFR